MNILYMLTRNYYPYLKWSITSLLEHNRPKMIYICAEDDSLPFEIPCKHKIINMSNQQYFLPTSPNINTPYSVMSLMRVCAPEILKANKVIYLDVDTIICDSLLPLWETDLTGKWLGWCREWQGHHRPYGGEYYNFGIAVMNLAEMRKDGVTQQLVALLNREYFRYNEQDALNRIIPYNKYVDIDVRYNECFCCGQTDNPAIIHYAGYRDWYMSRSVPRWEYLEKYRGV